MHYYPRQTNLNNELLPCHDECELSCLLALGCDLLYLLYSLSIRCSVVILIRCAAQGHGFRFGIFVLFIWGGPARFGKISLGFLVILFRLRILQGGILLISIHMFCCQDACSFRQCVEVEFECLFRVCVFVLIILNFHEIFVHFCSLDYFILRSLVDYGLLD
jgi:hypothetical protein